MLQAYPLEINIIQLNSSLQWTNTNIIYNIGTGNIYRAGARCRDYLISTTSERVLHSAIVLDQQSQPPSWRVQLCQLAKTTTSGLADSWCSSPECPATSPSQSRASLPSLPVTQWPQSLQKELWTEYTGGRGSDWEGPHLHSHGEAITYATERLSRVAPLGLPKLLSVA